MVKTNPLKTNREIRISMYHFIHWKQYEKVLSWCTISGRVLKCVFVHAFSAKIAYSLLCYMKEEEFVILFPRVVVVN